jgi:hypothetical protein
MLLLLLLLLLPFPVSRQYRDSAWHPLLQDGLTPLSRAADKGHNNVVMHLLRVGAAVDAANQVSPPRSRTDVDICVIVAWGSSQLTALQGRGLSSGSMLYDRLEASVIVTGLPD